jgi:hypothetical protein
MMNKYITPIILACLGVLAGAIVDVQVLKANVTSTKENISSRLDAIVDQLKEMKEDIKYIREQQDKE